MSVLDLGNGGECIWRSFRDHSRLGRLPQRTSAKQRAYRFTVSFSRPRFTRVRFCRHSGIRCLSQRSVDDSGEGDVAWGAWGIHDLDAAQFFFDTDDTAPTEIEGRAIYYEDIRDVPYSWTVEQKYANGPTVIHMDLVTAKKRAKQFELGSMASLVTGSKGWIWVRICAVLKILKEDGEPDTGMAKRDHTALSVIHQPHKIRGGDHGKSIGSSPKNKQTNLCRGIIIISAQKILAKYLPKKE